MLALSLHTCYTQQLQYRNNKETKLRSLSADVAQQINMSPFFYSSFNPRYNKIIFSSSVKHLKDLKRLS